MTGDYYEWEIMLDVQASFISSNKKTDKMMTSQSQERSFKIKKVIF